MNLKTGKRICAFLILIAMVTSSFACTPSAPIAPTGDSFELYDPYSGVDLNGEKMHLVKDGRAVADIVIPKSPTAGETRAASELIDYIFRATGVYMTIVSDDAVVASEGKVIVSIGRTSMLAQTGEDALLSGLGDSGFFSISRDHTVYVGANTADGLLYAVYNLLELFAGVRFLTQDDTVVPKTENLFVHPMRIVERPTFEVRDFYAYPIWFDRSGFLSKMRVNSPSQRRDESSSGSSYYAYDYTVRKDSGSYVVGDTIQVAPEGHTINYLLRAQSYVEGFTDDASAGQTWLINPYYDAARANADKYGYMLDWYAYDPASPAADKTTGRIVEEICYTNGIADDGSLNPEQSVAGKIQQIMRHMVKEDRNPQAKFLFLGHADHTFVCRCDRCNTAYEKYGGISGTMMVWLNAQTKALKAYMKETKIERAISPGMFAYAMSIEPPTVKQADGTYAPWHDAVKLDADAHIKFAYMSCVYHPLFDEACVANEQNRERLKGWQTVSNSINIWDYVANFKDYLWYMPDIGAMQENYFTYEELGTQHLLTQGTPSEYNFYQHHVTLYVSTKLMWNPRRDVNKLVKEFNEGYFGIAAPYVNEYRDYMESYYAKIDRDTGGKLSIDIYDGGSNKNAGLYSKEFFLKAISYIDQATHVINHSATLSSYEKETIVKRLKGVKITPQYMALEMGYIVEEAEKKLIASDLFASVAALNLGYVREGATPQNTFAELRKKYGI